MKSVAISSGAGETTMVLILTVNHSSQTMILVIASKVAQQSRLLARLCGRRSASFGEIQLLTLSNERKPDQMN